MARTVRLRSTIGSQSRACSCADAIIFPFDACCMVAWLPVSHGCVVRGVRGCTAVCVVARAS